LGLVLVEKASVETWPSARLRPLKVQALALSAFPRAVRLLVRRAPCRFLAALVPLVALSQLPLEAARRAGVQMFRFPLAMRI
jgi:hypothetical protein